MSFSARRYNRLIPRCTAGHDGAATSDRAPARRCLVGARYSRKTSFFRPLQNADSHAGGLLNAVRENRKFPIPINVIWVVQSFAQKYSASVVGQITGLTLRVSPDKRGGSRSSRTLR